jgi:REP element-mobilizing transposase RayT/predicted DNA-binding protein YlxM (UPF0122 family)
VILRGINRQTIFEDDGDRHYFMTVLQYYKGISGYKLHAFCLMGNHVHLLIEPAGEPLGQVFRRVGAKYVSWYNRKYERSGHLFQDRFRSENVDSEQYYRTVLRYILQNPMKAGLERQPGSWRWSSYLAYRKGAGSITDTQYALDLFGGRDALIRFVLQGNDDLVMDEESYDPRFREDRPKRIMLRITNCDNPSAFQQLERDAQREYVRQMYAEDVTLSQITRLTGMPKTTVYRILKGIRVTDSAEQKVEQKEPSPLFHGMEEAFVFNESIEEVW